MFRGSRSRPWLAIALLVAIAFVVILARRGPKDLSEDRATAIAEPAVALAIDALPEVRVDTGEGVSASRRIGEGCDPTTEALRYESLIEGRAKAILSWDGMPQSAAGLEIPVYVLGVEGGTILVRILRFPMREEYLHTWLGSGHIRPGPGDRFLLQPCSVTLEPWPDAD